MAGQPGERIKPIKANFMKNLISSLMPILLVPFVVTSVRAQIVEKKSLDLNGAKNAIAAAADYAKKHNAPGGVIAVVDEGGNLMALEVWTGPSQWEQPSRSAKRAPQSFSKSRHAFSRN